MSYSTAALNVQKPSRESVASIMQDCEKLSASLYEALCNVQNQIAPNNQPPDQAEASKPPSNLSLIDIAYRTASSIRKCLNVVGSVQSETQIR